MKYNLQEFIEIIKNKYKNNYPSVFFDKKFVGHPYCGQYEKCDPYLQIKWETGGVSGGSCWETSNPLPYTTNNVEPDFEMLDDILLEYVPKLSFLQYKQLNKYIKTDSETEYEYYGNCTKYGIKRILLKDLYQFICDNE